MTSEPTKLNEFPGFKTVDISFDDLVYLISDTQTGKLYVGSATDEGDIWGRWSQYVDGHGNNVLLKQLVGAEGLDRAKVYRFTVIEIADTHASPYKVRDRESHWKKVLLTRIHGWNAN